MADIPDTQDSASRLAAYNEIIRRERRQNDFVHKFCRNRVALLGFGIIVAILLLAILAPILSSYDPNKIDLINPFLKPGQHGHIFGTDDYGRDLFSRILYGARVSIVVSLGSILLGGLLGTLVGILAGYIGGAVDSILMRIMDGLSAFPYILLSILLITVLGSGLFNVILAIGIGTIPGFARVVRGQFSILKNEEYCNAERVLGASDIRLALVHILPNALPQIIVYATLHIASAIISESALSFLGLGIVAPTASWGNILRAGRGCLNSSPHIATIAGVFILITVIGFNLFGDGVRDVLDPKMKR
ncbi:glutathione transport system permease protein GsiD [Treponema primitia ZAS-2]|uniref:Glutathione transport system permease protein GsiD n=1 Tax=Treponema primitia (strain ATCC BAA-887 / DSM 12427 / ZAS-2) TaxID=545694 RepID=F5YNF4_TREPZ|nr:ABC transporter permease [Treponema primitia]AEF86732.1 glutathione transport system permease protein GsiD [Treponema primitia ZAS-2]